MKYLVLGIGGWFVRGTLEIFLYHFTFHKIFHACIAFFWSYSTAKVVAEILLEIQK